MCFFVTFFAEALHFLRAEAVVSEQVANLASFRVVLSEFSGKHADGFFRTAGNPVVQPDVPAYI